jgi:hypothetical protein
MTVRHPNTELSTERAAQMQRVVSVPLVLMLKLRLEHSAGIAELVVLW